LLDKGASKSQKVEWKIVQRAAKLRIGAGLILVFCLGTGVAHADGLIINTTFNDGSFTAAGYNLTDVHNAFNFAVTQFENLFTNPIDVNIYVTAGNTGLSANMRTAFTTLLMPKYERH
jgi:hypothetical protein